MDIYTSLYTGNLICLGPIDHDKDAEIVAQWTQDPEYLRMVDTRPAMPRSVAQVKKDFEKIEKDAEENKNNYYYTIREVTATPAELGRLVGFIRLEWIEWSHGSGWVRIGIGSPQDRRKGYGREALRLILRYAFAELNLYRLTAVIQEYNQPAQALFQQAGFVQEVCRRKALSRDGQAWDLLHFGLLRQEWEERMKG